MAGELVLLLAGAGVPEPDRAVVAAGGHGGAVGMVGHREDRAGVAGKPVLLLAGGGVPEPDRAVVAAGGQGGAVGMVGHGVHLADVTAIGRNARTGYRHGRAR